MKVLSFILFLIVLPFTLFAGDMAVTVYNSNLGVVSETRELDFVKGIDQLAFRDVPTAIDASSVTFEIIGSSRNVSILEQNYAYDLVSPDQIYSRYIDREIDMLDKDGKLYSGKLLAFNGGAVTLQHKEGGIKIVQLANIAETNFPKLPDGLITRPTLFWKYNSDFDGSLDCKVGYQTSGLGWQAEYIGVLTSEEDKLSLSGWASITNNSGKTYDDATLKLVAGDISRTSHKKMRGGRSPEVSLMAKQYDGFEEKAFFEYHLYTLPRKATLANKEIKQISLFEPANTPITKKYIYRPDVEAKKVEVNINFKNSKETGLGMPLPAGRIRLFKGDDDGSLILLGEDNIDHTPKNEELKVKVGYAFDIAAEEKMTDRNVISNKVDERSFEIEFRNHKDSPVTINVEKNLWDLWEVLDSSLPYTKKDARTIQFDVPVGAEETVKLTYKIRFTRQ
jgi:hypothetical protein